MKQVAFHLLICFSIIGLLVACTWTPAVVQGSTDTSVAAYRADLSALLKSEFGESRAHLDLSAFAVTEGIESDDIDDEAVRLAVIDLLKKHFGDGWTEHYQEYTYDSHASANSYSQGVPLAAREQDSGWLRLGTAGGPLYSSVARGLKP